MKVHPETPVTVEADFQLAGQPGSFDGTPTWTSNNAKDTLSDQQNDAGAGTSTISLDGSANSNGDTSIIHIEADVDKGRGVQTLTADSELLEWTDTVQVVADDITIKVSQVA